MPARPPIVSPRTSSALSLCCELRFTLSRMSPRSALALALVAGLALVPASAPASRAHAAAYRTCHMSAHDAEHMGAGYIANGQYKVQGVSCAKGKQVVKAFHACRKAHGGAKYGRCPATASVLGFHCKEGKRTKVPGEFTAQVVCSRGSKRVQHYYTNFT